MIRMLRFLFLLGTAAGLQADVLYMDSFDNDGLSTNNGIGGGAVSRSIQSHHWDDIGYANYEAPDEEASGRALLLSKNSFQCENGFTLSAQFLTENLSGHTFSIGLISSDSQLSVYAGFNPFEAGQGIYGVGVNLASNNSAEADGVHFSNGSSSKSLNPSAARVQIKELQLSVLTLEIEKGGSWCYRIDGEYAASGVLVEGFDLTKSYHVAVYGQGSVGARKALKSLKLKSGYAQGERARKTRGTWSGGMGLDKVKDLRTMDTIQVRFTDGAVLSASHWAPHKLLEKLWGGDVDEKGKPVNLCVPRWGDLSKAEPENDPIREKMEAIKAAGFQVKAYGNCENFNGSNTKEFEVIAQRWKEYCDTDSEVVAFVNSQPFHTGVWDRNAERYVDATDKFPNRKYMFCYAELVLKDYALRYGDLIDEWIFDSATDINQAGDKFDSGLVEEQRIYQAFAKAVHAGNPDIAIAFNNGRSTVKSPHFPYAFPTRYDDFTFGHSFGGNNNHADKKGGTFNRNYKHITRMTETKGFVFAGGKRDWDDLIVGNMHSKLATTSWKSGPKQAWEEKDFIQWTMEAMQAGGCLTWDGSATSKYQRNWVLRGWAYDLLKAVDDYLAVHESPGAPNWARAYTILPDAVIGRPYRHVLIAGKDLWDPEGDPIVLLGKAREGPAWLKIKKDTRQRGQWVLSGEPSGKANETLKFRLGAKDSTGRIGVREVEIRVVQ